MSKEIEIEHIKGAPTHGKTNYDQLKNMTEEEIQRNADKDEDLPLQSDDDLKRFKKVTPKR